MDFERKFIKRIDVLVCLVLELGVWKCYYDYLYCLLDRKLKSTNL